MHRSWMHAPSCNRPLLVQRQAFPGRHSCMARSPSFCKEKRQIPPS